MYTADGYLTEYGKQQTEAEIREIGTGCTRQFEQADGGRYECLRQLVPLEMRTSREFAELLAVLLSNAKGVTDGYAEGNISEATTLSTLTELEREYRLSRQILIEHYNRVVFARNAREREAARRNLGNALSQVGSTLVKESSPGSSRDITCRETVPGTVSCSEW
jgi:hypothetical protein